MERTIRANSEEERMKCPICNEEIGEYGHTLYDPIKGTFHAECYYKVYLPKPSRAMEYACYLLLFALAVKLLKLGVLIWNIIV